MITLKTYFCVKITGKEVKNDSKHNKGNEMDDFAKVVTLAEPLGYSSQDCSGFSMYHKTSHRNQMTIYTEKILSAPRLAWQLLLYNVQSLSHIIALGLQSGRLLQWHLHLSSSCCWRLYGTFVEGLTTQSGCQSFSKHTAQEHIDQRVQAYISGRQPQGGFLGDVECILCTAMTRYAASLGQSVGNADKVKGSKADEKYSHNHKHLCFGSVSRCLSSAFWGFVWLINLFAD